MEVNSLAASFIKNHSLRRDQRLSLFSVIFYPINLLWYSFFSNFSPQFDSLGLPCSLFCLGYGMIYSFCVFRCRSEIFLSLWWSDHDILCLVGLVLCFIDSFPTWFRFRWLLYDMISFCAEFCKGVLWKKYLLDFMALGI